MNRFLTFSYPLFFLLMLLAPKTEAQVDPVAFGYDWIEFDNDVFAKVPVSRTGITRIPYETLTQLPSFPRRTRVSPRRFRVFYRGKEIPVRVIGEEDDSFDPGDYIEVYTQRNPGDLEELLYERPEDKTNPYQTLFTNNSYYFVSYQRIADQFGKRMEVVPIAERDTTPPIPFHIQETIRSYNDVINWGEVNPSTIITRDPRGGAVDSRYVEGKGYTSNFFAAPTLQFGRADIDFPVENVYQDTLYFPQAEISIKGRINAQPNSNDVFVGTPNELVQQPELRINRYDQIRLRYTASPQTGIPFPEQNGTFRFRTQPSARPATYTEYSISFGRLRYPQTFEGEVPESGKVFRIIPTASRLATVEIPNPPEAPRVYDITDPTNVRELEYETTARGGIRFVADQLDRERKIWVVSQSVYGTATTVMPVKFLDLSQIDPSVYDYLLINHPDLKGSVDPIALYKRYRESPEGGGFRVLDVEIEQIYNTFTYGEVTPLAIRRFLDFMLRLGDPKFLFLVGKGLHFEYRYEDRLPNSANWSKRNLIPPFGFPGTDYEYSAGLGARPELIPAIPTGRLPAMTPEHVKNYLDKVVEYEAGFEGQSWRKNILQLSGGVNANENRLFRGYMASFARIAEGDYLGANVSTIAKQTTDFVEFFNISEEINRGVGLLTFFGHASLSVTDIEIGNVTNPALGYNNKGRYPLIMVNGCGSGDIYTTSNSSFAENWMLAKDRGAIAFLAHSHLGFSGVLRFYTENFYRTAFGSREYINKTLGEVVQQTIRTVTQQSPNSPIVEACVQQVVFQGDPALRLVPFEQPDYAITTGDLTVTPFDPQNEFFVSPDSFAIEVNIRNLGIVDKGRRPFKVAVRRTFSDGTIVAYPAVTVPYVINSEVIRIPIVTREENRPIAGGRNQIEVFVDEDNQIEELSERNNAAQLSSFFGASPLLTVFPREYSIVNDAAPEVNFIAQNPNFDGTPKRYLLQIDTTDRFDSPVLSQEELTSREQVLRWIASLPVPQEETVHYWRVRELSAEDTLWTNSSFVYIPEGPEGWSQSHFAQFKKARLTDILAQEDTYRWTFDTYQLDMDFYAYNPNRGERPYNIRINQEDIVEGNCGTNRTTAMVVIDQFTGEIYRPRPGQECGNSLSATSLDIRQVVQRVGEIREGDWVILMASTNIVGVNAAPAYIEAAQLIGADSTVQIGGARAFVMVGKRGGTKEDFLLALPDSRGIIELSHSVSGTKNEGQILSSRIGPALEWNTLIHNISGVETADKGWTLDLLSEDEDGRQTIAIQDIEEENLDISGISTAQSPYLRLRLSLFDRQDNTPEPSQLAMWRVIYGEVPEGILLYDTLSYKPNTTLEIQEGDPIQLNFAFENISGSDFSEPLQVQYEIQNQNTGQTTMLRDTLNTLPANEVLRFQTNFNSVDFFGNNQLFVTVNPRVQAEQRYDNNVLPVRFTVKPDDINPVLDVAFDGKHIMDGDIVAPSPVISVVLQDESRVNIRQDTTGINLFLQRNDCEGCSPQRIAFSDPRVSWQANDNNRFEITYQPEPLADGSYNLSVQGEDLSGNLSGIAPYQVNFEVINASTITHFYPYPNPFSTSMRFVFTLTGQSVPDDIKIQIMTISGKVVRTITRDELGPLRIGDNITEFAWDGTDEYGDQLANGVYLYKVSIRDREQSFEQRDTPRDDLFRHNIGKIYLMR